MTSLYPNVNWQPWRFEGQLPKKFWEDANNEREYLKWLKDKLEIDEDRDWYLVSGQEIRDLKGGGLLTKYGGVYSMIEECFGVKVTINSRGNHTDRTSKTQACLMRILRNIFPKETVVPNWKPDQFTYMESSRGSDFFH
jgi:hypothetical protein